MNNYDSVISSFYLAYYGRPADPDGLAFWSAHLQRANGDLTDITRVFGESEEATVRFASKTTSERIEDVYLQLFNRKPDAAGLAYWAEAVESGHATMADVSLEILKGAQGSDGVISGKRQAAADEFTKIIAELDAKFIGQAAVNASHAMLMAINESTTQAMTLKMIESLVPMSDTLSVTPSVLDAIVPGGGIDALFLTPRGRAEPENLFFAMSDLTKAAAGNPLTLDALLRGGGMGKVLEVMPSKSSLADVVGALGKGGLDAAIEVVYPSPKPAPIPAATMNIEFNAGTLTLAGNATDPAVVNLDKKIITFKGQDQSIAGKIEKVIVGGYAGKVALSGTVEQLQFVGPQSPGTDLQIVDSKSAIFVGTGGIRLLAPGAEKLINLSQSIKLNEPVSAVEYQILKNVPNFNIGKLQSSIDLTPPVAGKLAFEGLTFTGVDGKVAFTNKDTVSFNTSGVEEFTTIRFQKYEKTFSSWVDLPSVSVTGLAEGEHKFRSVVEDAAGNISHDEAIVNVDLTAPIVTRLRFDDNPGAIGAGKNVTLNVSFDGPVTVGEGARIHFSNDGSAVYQSGSGSDTVVFSYTPQAGHGTPVLKLDPFKPFSGMIADPAGNALTAAAFADAVLEAAPQIDVAAPAQAIGFDVISQSTGISAILAGPDAPLPTNQAVATVYASMQGYLGIGERVEYSVNGGADWSERGVSVVEQQITIADVATIASPTIMLRVVDKAGNAGPVASRAIVYDDLPPQAGSLAFAKVSESDQDSNKGDNVTDVAVASVTFKHSGDWLAAGDRLQYTTDGLNWSSLNLQANAATGEVTIAGLRLDQGSLVDDGVTRITTVAVRAIDAAGNPSILGEQDLVYQKTVAAPALALYRDSGIDDDRITNVDQVTVSNLSKTVGASWEYSLDNGAKWIPGYGIDQDGRSSFMVGKDGDYQVLVRQKVDGVLSAEGKYDFRLDTTPLELMHDTTRIDGNLADVSFLYAGSLEQGDKIEYRIDGGDWLSDARIVVGSSGDTITVTGIDLTKSDPKVELRVTDVAGNESLPASATVDGPYTVVMPKVTTLATADGLVVTSTVAGSMLAMSSPTGGYGVNHTGGGNTITAGVPVTIGVQPWIAQGPLAVRTTSDNFVFDTSGRVYLFGRPSGDTLEYLGSANAGVWGFDGDDTIRTGDGNDIIYGGHGVNNITAGKGADHIDLVRGVNTLNFKTGDSSLAGGIDVVTFGSQALNPTDQTFQFEFAPLFNAGTIYTSDPASSSMADLTQWLDGMYMMLAGGAEGGAMVVRGSSASYLVVETGDGKIDGSDFVIELVGQAQQMRVDSGNVVFSYSMTPP